MEYSTLGRTGLRVSRLSRGRPDWVGSCRSQTRYDRPGSAINVCSRLGNRDRRISYQAILATATAGPHVAYPTLPSTLLRSGSITLYLLFAVALDAPLYLFVDLAQRQATGSFQFVRIGFVCHGNGSFLRRSI
ncbi:hypothetical protein OKW45_002737 [Paraburkholderia sp. WSM4175]